MEIREVYRIWNGQPLQLSSYGSLQNQTFQKYQRDFKGLVLKVGHDDIQPLSFKKTINGSAVGLLGDVWTTLGQDLNFT